MPLDLTNTTKAETLLEEVKNFLDITWVDDLSDKKLVGMIIRGMAYIGRLSPEEIDYQTHETAKRLLLQHILYDRENRLADFYENYRPDLLSFKLDEEIDEYGKKGATDV